MKIQFIQEYTVKNQDQTTYKVGKVLDCNANSARHFIDRGVAIEFKGKHQIRIENTENNEEPEKPEVSEPKKRGRPPKQQ